MEELELTDGMCIGFKDRTDSYGRAEFILCPIYKRGKIVELFVYARQQKDIKYFLHWKSEWGRPSFDIQAYEGLSDPKIWRGYYDKEHKTQAIELYVPSGAKYLWFATFSHTVTIGFTVKAMSDKVINIYSE